MVLRKQFWLKPLFVKVGFAFRPSLTLFFQTPLSKERAILLLGPCSGIASAVVKTKTHLCKDIWKWRVAQQRGPMPDSVRGPKATDSPGLWDLPTQPTRHPCLFPEKLCNITYFGKPGMRWLFLTEAPMRSSPDCSFSRQSSVPRTLNSERSVQRYVIRRNMLCVEIPAVLLRFLKRGHFPQWQVTA